VLILAWGACGLQLSPFTRPQNTQEELEAGGVSYDVLAESERVQAERQPLPFYIFIIKSALVFFFYFFVFTGDTTGTLYLQVTIKMYTSSQPVDNKFIIFKNINNYD
jgi:hypothetical protein